MDLYLVVEDNKVDEAFCAVEKALTSLSPIKQKLDVIQSPWPDLSQMFYRLEYASEYLIIDFAVLKLSSSEKFLEPQTHGNVVVYFNKSDKVKLPKLDREFLATKLNERSERLQARFNMFNNFVQKEINRGNSLEAIDLYHNLTLATMVEALRIKHNPVHHDFKMRYVHYEFPLEVIEKLKHLYFVSDESDLKQKYREASEWFRKLATETGYTNGKTR